MPKRLGILTRDARVESTILLADACRSQGVEPVILPIRDARLDLSSEVNHFRIRFAEAPSLDLSAVVPRIGSFMPRLALAALRALVRRGIPSLLEPDAIEKNRDRWRQLESLGAAGVPSPDSIRIQDWDQLGDVVDALNGPPVVWKPGFGDRGRGVFVARDRGSAIDVARQRLADREEIYAQRWIDTGDRPVDTRILVVDGRVVAAMRRRGAPGAAGSNLHQGGVGEPVIVDQEDSKLATRAAEVSGLPLAGVDVIRAVDRVDGESSVVLEVNASPGLSGITAATRIDVATPIIEAALRG